MAVTNETSDEFKNQTANPVVHIAPTELSGRNRVAFFNFVQSAAAGDANSTIELLKLLVGRFRMTEIDLKVSAFGSSRVLKIGHRAATALDGFTVIAENLGFFATGIDVSSAVSVKTYVNKKLETFKGVTIVAQVTGGTIPAAATVEGFITYVND